MIVRVGLCGPLRLDVDGIAMADRVHGRKGRLALAYLALHRERSVSRDELMGALWGDDEAPAAPDAALSTILSRLRTAVAPAQLRGREQLVLELGEHCEIDWETAQRAAARRPGDPREALAAARSALAILDRPFLAGVGSDWVEERRREQRVLRVHAFEALGRAALELGGGELAVAEQAGHSLVELEPYRESGYALLMEAHAARGNAAEAVRVYHELRELLRDELGVAPASEITALNESLLTGAGPAERPRSDGSVRPSRGPPRAPRRPAPADPFVGRRPELTRLVEHLDAAVDGASRLVVLSGEPGIGKTQLVVKLMHIAEERGARVLYGGGDVEAALPYQPVAEALQEYVADSLDEIRAAGLGAELAELDRLIPGVGPAAEPPVFPADPEMLRFRLFQSVATTLAHAATARPLLLVLDDLRWADRSTRELLAHLVRAPEVPRTLTLAVHRLESAAALVSAARRYRVVDHIELLGLKREDCGDLVRATIPQASDTLIDRLASQTAGNPFFLEELARSLRDGQTDVLLATDDVEVPPGIRAAVTHRLERFGEETLKVLRAAAVAGQEFDVAILDHALSIGTEAVLDAVEAALAAGLLVEDRHRPDRFSFSHALVRGTLYGGQTASRRTRLHLAVGTALEAADGTHPAELAHHFWEARSVGGAERATSYHLAAGRLADDAFAWEDAARHYERALEAAGADDARRGELLLAYGDALEHSGDSTRAKRVFLDATDLARREHDAALLSRAALGYGRAPGPAFAADTVLLELLQDARAALGDDDRALRSRVLGRLAVERASVDGGHATAAALSAEAVALAEAAGDDIVLAIALASRHWTLSGPAMLDERCEVARRGLELAIHAGDRERELAGREWWLFDLLELGDVAAVEEQLASYDALARTFRHPSYGGYSLAFHAMLTLLRGEHEVAERLIEEANAMLVRAVDPDAARVHALQRFVLLLQRDEAPLAAGALDAMTPERHIWSCLRAWAWAEHGDLERAERAIVDPALIQEDGEWIASMTALAHAAAALGDRGLARRLAARLDPYAGRVAAIAGVACFGSVAHSVGRIRIALGETEAGERLLRRALDRSTEMGAGPAAERVRRDLPQPVVLREGGR